MSFLQPSPEEDQELRRRAALGIKAADLLLTLKLMSLDRQIETLASTIGDFEKAGLEADALVETHLDLSRRKHYLQSSAGQHGFRMELLIRVFEKELNEPITFDTDAKEKPKTQIF